MSESPKGEPPAREALAEKLRSCATGLDNFAKYNRRESIIGAVAVAVFAALGITLGIYGISEQKRFNRVMEKVADDVAALRTMTETNCDAIMSVVERASFSEAQLQEMCSAGQVHAGVKGCLREASICQK